MLTADYTAIKNWETVVYQDATENDIARGAAPGSRVLRPDVFAVVAGMMAMGMSELTEKTYLEFMLRQRLWNGYYSYNQFPRELVRSLIGLKVNVAQESRAKWLKRMADGWARSLIWDERRLAEEEAAEPKMQVAAVDENGVTDLGLQDVGQLDNTLYSIFGE